MLVAPVAGNMSEAALFKSRISAEFTSEDGVLMASGYTLKAKLSDTTKWQNLTYVPSSDLKFDSGSATSGLILSELSPGKELMNQRKITFKQSVSFKRKTETKQAQQPTYLKRCRNKCRIKDPQVQCQNLCSQPQRRKAAHCCAFSEVFGWLSEAQPVQLCLGCLQECYR